MDLLLGTLGKAGVLLAVTAMLFSLQSWLLEHDQGVKVNFTWDAIGGMLEQTTSAKNLNLTGAREASEAYRSIGSEI